MKNSKLIQFLNYIIEEQDFQKTSMFARKLNVSNKTISNYVNELKYYIRCMSNIHLEIVSKHGVGIRMEGTLIDKQTFKESFVHGLDDYPSSNQRQKSILEKLLMRDEVISIRKLSDEFNISSTSIVKDLEIVEQQLSQYDVTLKREKSGTSICGKEQRIRSAKRKFIYSEFMSLTQQNKVVNMTTCTSILSNYISKDCQQISKEMIKMALDKLSFQLDKDYYIQIFVSFSIFISRIKQHQYLQSSPVRPVVTELHILKTYPIAVELAQWLKEKHGLDLPDLDIRWMNARIAGVYHEDQKAKAGYTLVVEDIVNELVCSIGDIFNVNFQNDEVLKTGLANHFVPMISRLKNNIKITNPFILQIKQQYTAMFSVICLASSIIEKKIDNQLSDDEIGFILIHIQAALERHNLSKKIAVVYDCGLANALLIENQIKINLPTFDVLELIHIKDLEEVYLKDFDLIISTMEIQHTDKPNVVITPVADSNDIQNIKLTYESMIQNVKETKFYHLLQILSADMILVNQKFKTKYEVLEKANSILLSKGYITPDFYPSILNREKLSSTEIGNGIAIPHGLDKYVNHTSIVLIILDEPVLWKEDKVSVVFFTAASFRQKDVLKRLLKDLYHLISSQNFVESIRSARTKEEVLSILYGKQI